MKEELLSTSALNSSVTTKNGVVTLSGKTKNAAEKDWATNHVNDVNGVKSVKNQMVIEQSDSKTKETVFPLPVGRVMQ